MSAIILTMRGPHADRGRRIALNTKQIVTVQDSGDHAFFVTAGPNPSGNAWSFDVEETFDQVLKLIGDAEGRG